MNAQVDHVLSVAAYLIKHCKRSPKHTPIRRHVAELIDAASRIKLIEERNANGYKDPAVKRRDELSKARRLVQVRDIAKHYRIKRVEVDALLLKLYASDGSDDGSGGFNL